VDNLTQKMILNHYKIENRVVGVHSDELIGKLSSILKIKAKNDGSLLLDHNVERKESKDTEDSEKIHRGPSRYFEKNNSVTCYRCGNEGHQARLCAEKSMEIKCFNCLGKHISKDCNSIFCYKCNKMGHIARDCRETERQVYCNRCGRKGHQEIKCGKLIKQFQKEDIMFLRCLNCEVKGHLNCFKVEYHRNDGIYDGNADENDRFAFRRKKKKLSFEGFEFEGKKNDVSSKNIKKKKKNKKVKKH